MRNRQHFDIVPKCSCTGACVHGMVTPPPIQSPGFVFGRKLHDLGGCNWGVHMVVGQPPRPKHGCHRDPEVAFEIMELPLSVHSPPRIRFMSARVLSNMELCSPEILGLSARGGLGWKRRRRTAFAPLPAVDRPRS